MMPQRKPGESCLSHKKGKNPFREIAACRTEKIKKLF
jgi:hypothetical protein